MSISIMKDVTTAIPQRGKHIVIYSMGGVGKTTCLANAVKKEKGLLILSGEDGLAPLNIADVPHINVGTECGDDNDKLSQSWCDFKDVLKQIIVEKHSYPLVCIDPISSMMPAMDAYIVKTFYKGNQQNADAYSKKYSEYQTEFNSIIEAIKVILTKNITVITTCHGNIVDFRDPSSENYKKWDITLPGGGIGSKVSLGNMLFNHADAVLFGCVDVVLVDNKPSGKRRVLKTEGDASYVAKNRLGLPEKILFDYDVIKPFLFPVKKV